MKNIAAEYERSFTRAVTPETDALLARIAAACRADGRSWLVRRKEISGAGAEMLRGLE